MAKAKKCSKCEKPAMPNRPECEEHYAEYMREYRRLEATKRDQSNHIRGFEEGVRKVADLMRKKVAGSAVTGLQAAVIIERAYLTPEAPGVAERAKLIASMMPYR